MPFNIMKPQAAESGKWKAEFNLWSVCVCALLRIFDVESGRVTRSLSQDMH